MKPNHLAFCALGPYPDEVEIDFDKLVADELFLIWGRTGAGKTFLLDALCFALFGEVPGERPYGHPSLRPRATRCGAAGGTRIQLPGRLPKHSLAHPPDAASPTGKEAR